MSEVRDAYDVGFYHGHIDGLDLGYARGEAERIALATENSNLRSQVLDLTNRLEGLR